MHTIPDTNSLKCCIYLYSIAWTLTQRNLKPHPILYQILLTVCIFWIFTYIHKSGTTYSIGGECDMLLMGGYFIKISTLTAFAVVKNWERFCCRISVFISSRSCVKRLYLHAKFPRILKYTSNNTYIAKK